MKGKSDGVFFRDSMRGYNKSDVNEYIEKLSHDYAESEEALQKKIASLEAELESAKRSAAEPQSTATTDENESLRRECAELKCEIESLKEKLVDSTEDHRKALLYDRMSGKLGDVLIHAGEAADDMLKNAESEAQRKGNDVTTKLDSLMSATKQKFDAMTEQSLTSYTAHNVKTQLKLKEFIKWLEDETDATSQTLSENVKKLYDETIAEIKTICAPTDGESK